MVATKQAPKKKTKKKSGSRAMFGMLYLMSFSILIMLGLSVTIYYVITHPAKRDYFSTTVNGRTTPLVALALPNQSDPAILQWAAQAAISAHTYDFVNYQRQLDDTAKFFTSSGWNDFVAALVRTNTVDSVVTKQLIVSAVATSKPVILAKGEISGDYYWRIQMPILVTYQSPSDFSQEGVVVTLLVRRISTLKSPKGIGIDQFIVSTAGIGR